MADPNPFELGFPLGGVNKATAFASQPEGTTPSSLNVWPYHYPDGRLRGGTRPGLTSAGFPSADPYNWCHASWVGDSGIAVTSSAGTYVTSNGSTWNLRIATAPSSDFSSCAVLNGVLYQASSEKTKIRQRNLSTLAVEGDLNVTNYTDGSPKGSVPTNCGLVLAQGGRLFLGGDKNNPQILYVCAVNDTTDWDVSSDDEGAAWASSGVAGAINRPIVGLLSHGNGCVLVGHLDAITVVRGDPRVGGAIEEIDQYAGPVMNTAWCKTGDDQTAILTREELSLMAPGCGSPRITISRFKLPHDLAAVNPSGGDTASVAYDGRFGGLIILVRRQVAEASFEFSQFFFDLAGKGFSPMAFASGEFRVGVTFSKGMTRTRGSSIILKNNGGSYFNTASTESIASHVFIGPIRMGNAVLDGILSRIAFELSEDSDPVDFEIYAGSSAQEAYNSTARYSGRLTRKGLSYSFHPRLVGQVAWVKLFETGTSRWAIERAVGETYPKSRRRVRYDAP